MLENRIQNWLSSTHYFGDYDILDVFVEAESRRRYNNAFDYEQRNEWYPADVNDGRCVSVKRVLTNYHIGSSNKHTVGNAISDGRNLSVNRVVTNSHIGSSKKYTIVCLQCCV